MTTKDVLLKTANDLVAQGITVLQRVNHDDFPSSVEPKPLTRLRHLALNLADKIGAAADIWKPSLLVDDHSLVTASKIVGAVEALRDAIAGDLLLSVESMVVANAFGDMLEQADHLLENGYCLAAGVVGRAVLEEHLRKWCERTGRLPSKPKPTIGDYNAALYEGGKGVIDKLAMNQITAMAVVGNDAAHNDPKLTKENVEWFLRELGSFLILHPLP